MKALLTPLNPILEDRPDRNEIEIKNKQLSQTHEYSKYRCCWQKKKASSSIPRQYGKKSQKMKAYIYIQEESLNSTMHERRNTRNERKAKLFVHNTTNSVRSQSNLFRNFLVHTRLLIWAHTALYLLPSSSLALVYTYYADTDMGLNAIMQSGYGGGSLETPVYQC